MDWKNSSAFHHGKEGMMESVVVGLFGGDSSQLPGMESRGLESE